MSPDNRQAERQARPSVVAHYWTGAAPMAIGIRDISSKGLYLLTDERWYPGTVVKITLQGMKGTDESPGQSIAVQSKVVRWDTDGVGLAFVLASQRDPSREKGPMDVVMDQKTLDIFLTQLRANNSEVRIDLE